MGYVPSRLGDEGRRTQRAVLHPTMRDLAWAAGIYEGEGTCVRNGKGSSTAVVTQKDRWLLDRFQQLFGGRIYLRTYRRTGYGSSEMASNFRWQINGKRARGFLLTMYTFLSPRRRTQIRRALGVAEVTHA